MSERFLVQLFMRKLLNSINSLGHLYVWWLVSMIWHLTIIIRYKANSYLSAIQLMNMVSLSIWKTVISELLWNGVLKNFLIFRNNTTTSNILLTLLIISSLKHLIYLSKQFLTILTIYYWSVDLICNIQLLLFPRIHLIK